MRRETREDPQKASSSTPQQPSSDKKPEDAEIKPQDPDHGVSPEYPVLYPGLVPGSNHGQYDEQTNRGAGVYAVPVHVQITGGVAFEMTLCLGLDQAMRLRLGERTKRKVGKFSSSSNNLQLAAVIYLFNQDGSRQRLAVLVIFATIIYLYQTGALASFIRWLSQGMHRAAVPPPRAHRPAGRGDNDPAAAISLNQDAVPGEEGQENEASDGNRANANESVGAGEQGNQWWGIVKEIQVSLRICSRLILPNPDLVLAAKNRLHHLNVWSKIIRTFSFANSYLQE
ncbi:hypothetical protein Bca4012_093214 [Brassica carinata]